MKEVSSNHHMGSPIDLLANIKAVPAPDHLYNRILLKTKKKGVISMTWVKAVAAVFVCLMSIEMYLVVKQNSLPTAAAMEEWVPTTNNMLYNE